MKSSRSNKNNPNKRMTASVHEGMASGVSKFRHSYSKSKRIIAFALALAMVLGLVYVDGKRKEARADSEDTSYTDASFETGSEKEDFSGFFKENMMVDSSYLDGVLGGLTKKSANASAGDLFAPTNVLLPSDKISLALPQMGIYYSEEKEDEVQIAKRCIWIDSSVTLSQASFKSDETDIFSDLTDSANFLNAPGSEVNSISSGNAAKLVCVTFSRDKEAEVPPEEGQELVKKWKYSAYNEYNTVSIQEAIPNSETAAKELINDLSLQYGDVTNHYSVKEASDCDFVKKYTYYYASKTQITGTSDFKDKLGSADAAMAVLNVDGNEGDGTFYVYKVVAIPYNNDSENKVAYGYFEGKLTRDFYTNASESDIKVYNGSSELTDTTIDPLGENYKIVINVGGENDIAYSISDGDFYGIPSTGDVNVLKGEDYTATIDLPKSGDTDSDGRPDYCGKDVTIKVILTQGTKKPVEKTITLTYDDGAPTFVLGASGISGVVKTDAENRKYYVKGHTATVNADLTAGGSFATISKDDIKVSAGEGGTVTVNSSLETDLATASNRSLADYGIATVSVTEDSEIKVSGSVSNSYKNSNNLKVDKEASEPGFTIVFDGTEPSIVVDSIDGSNELSNSSDVYSFTDTNKELTCSKDVAVKLSLSDAMTGLDNSTVTASIDGDSAFCSIAEDTENPGTFILNIPTNTAFKGLTKTVDISAKDNVGNEKSIQVKIPYSEEKITFLTGCGIEFEAGDSYTDASSNVYNNGKFKLVYKIESDMPISEDDALPKATLEATLKGDTDSTVDLAGLAKSKDITNTTTASDTKYHYTVTYTFTPDTLATSKYENILFNIENVNGFAANTAYKIDIITIDLTNPTLTVSEDITSVKGDGDWYRSLYLNIVYKDDANAIASGVNKIVVTNVDGETSKTIDVTSSTDPGYKIVKVNDSTSETDGKTVSVKAFDNVGNGSVEWTNENPYYVDGQNPVPSLSVLVNGAVPSSSEMYDGDPKITIKATDNIKIASYTMKVTDPEGTETTKETPLDGITTGIESQLFSVAAKKDGTYKIEFECKDQAGNTVSATPVSVTLDNTAPVVKYGEVIQTKTPDNKVAMDSSDEEKEYAVDVFKRITSTEAYSVVFAVNEKNIKSITVKEDGTEVTPSTSTDGDGNTLYTITGTKGAKGATITYEIEVIDKAGSRKYRKFSIKCLEERMNISRAISNTGIEVAADGSVMTNVGKFNIVYTIDSDTELTKDNITYSVIGADAEAAGFVSDDKDTNFVCTKTSDYNYTSTFTVSVDVPADTEVKLGEMGFSAVNSNGVAGNALDPATLNVIVDTLKPATKNVTISQVSSFGTETQDATTSDVTFTKYLSSNGIPADFTIDLTDTYIVDSSITVTKKIGSDAETTVSGTTYASGQLKFTETPNEDFGGKKVTYKVTAKDQAGNKLERSITVNYLKDYLTISYDVLNYENTFKKDNESDVNDSNDGDFTVRFTIKSNSPLDKDATSITQTGDSTNIYDAAKYKDFTVDAATNTYVYTYDFKVETAKDASVVLDNLKMAVKNVNNKTASSTVSVIRVDMLDPNISVADNATGVTPLDQWFSNLTLLVKYDDSTGQNFSSGIKSITAEGVENADPTNYGITTSGVQSGQFKVDVKQSPDVNGTEVKFVVTDMVGNVKTFEHTYKVDHTIPDPVDLKVNNELVSGKYYSGDPKVSYSISEDIQIKEYKLDIKVPTKEDPLTTKSGVNLVNPGITEDNLALSSLIGTSYVENGMPIDGEYDVKLTSSNMPGVAGTEMSTKFYVDNTAPVIDNIKVTQPASVEAFRNVDSTSWKGASSSHPVSITFDTIDKIVNSSSVGLKSIVVTEKIGEDAETEIQKIDSFTNGKEKQATNVVIGADSKYAGKVVTYKITATDILGNESSETFTVSYVLDNVVVSHTHPDTTKTKEDTIKITYTIESDAPVKKSGISVSYTANPNDGKVSGELGELNPVAAETDVANDKYKYTIEYTLKATDSDKITDITCSATNINGIKSNEDKISFVYIDLQDPNIIIAGGANETDWFENLELKLTCSDNEREFVSGIKSVKITGIKQDIGDGYIIPNDKIFDVSVDVLESPTLSGTEVTMEIEDKVGRKTTYTYTFHVDETDPTSELFVNGKTAAEVDGTFFGETDTNPAVVYKTDDNIQVAEYTLDIKLPSGDTIHPVKGNDTTAPIDVTTTLADLIGAENCVEGLPKDGTYTLTFSVKDRADRVPDPNPIVTTFTLDNSIPVNDLQILNTEPGKFNEYKNTYDKTPSSISSYEYGQYYAEEVKINAIVVDDNVEEVTVLDNDVKVDLEFGETGGIKEFTVSGDGYHKVTINTKDKSGLDAVEAVVEFTIDTTAPKSAITVNGVDSTNTGEGYYIGFTDYEKDPEIKFTVDENIKQYEYQIDILDPKGGNHEKVYYEKEKEGSFTDTKKLSELSNMIDFALADELPQDGKYVISLYSEDMADNEAKPVNPAVAEFYLDNTAPKLDIGTIALDQTGNNDVIQRSVGQNNVVIYRGVTAKSSSESGGKFTISYETSDPKVNNSASGLDPENGIVITEKLNGNTRNVEFTKDPESDTVTFEVTANEDYVGKVVEYIITSTDAVGNSISRTVRISFAEDKITVKHQGYDNARTDTTNGKFDIVYDIISDVPITPDEEQDILDAANISLTMVTVDGTLDKDSAGKGVLKKADSYDSEDFKYEYVYTYSIDKTLSDKLQNITVTATNNNGVTSEADVISLINIDLTDPSIRAMDPNESQWFQGLQVMFGYNDGNREFMSGIKSIKITGVKQGLNDYFQSDFDIGKLDGEGRVLNGYVTVDVNESKDLNGTKVTADIMDNLGRRMDTRSYTFHVDEHNPTSSLTVNGQTAAAIDGSYIGTNSLNPSVAYTANDNIQVKSYSLKITLPSGQTITAASGSNTNNISVPTTLGDLIGASNMNGSVPKDGEYTLTYEVYDMAGRVPEGGAITTTFVLDNTTPKNDLQITTGRPPKFDKFNSTYKNDYTGRSYQYGQYYNTNVSIDAIVTDNNVENITITDNGSVIYSGTALETNYVISSEGTHVVSISTVDKAGLRAATESVSFTIDKTVPVLSTSLNSAGFTDGGAMRYYKENGYMTVSYSEANKDTEDLIMTVTRTAPGGGQSTTSPRISEGQQSFTEEGEYTVKIAVTDRAGNKGAEHTVSFRIDKTKPELTFTGTVDHGTSTKSVSMNYNVREAYYHDMNSCSLRIYKKVDGANEVLLKTMDIKPTNSNYSISETFNEDGEYRFEMTAEDKCGNPSTASFTFILDGKAPIITLAGVKNYDKTSEEVTLGITIDETFFTSNKVVLKGTRIDIDGVKNDVKFSDFVTNSSKISKFEQIFKEDGIYDITITSTDKAGNSTTQKVHFTKDTTDPELKGVDDYDGKVINSFKWSGEPEDLIRDLTVCEIMVYMDGVQYNGRKDLADGSHVLRVIATDELGHTTDKEISFLLDTIAPNILISGVEEGQYLKETTQITVAVQIDEDKLTKVTLNGQEVQIVDGVAKISINQRGSYKLQVEAVDEAGNITTREMSFNFGEKFPIWIFFVGGGGLLLMLLLLLLAKRRKKDKKAA